MIHHVGPSAGCDFVIGGCLLHNDKNHEVLRRLKVRYFGVIQLGKHGIEGN